MKELHKCKYCGVETTQSDEECYANPKQETLEEFIKDELQDEFFTNVSEYKKAEKFIHIGAKWQQARMYSEEDLEVAFFEGQFGKYSFNDWLEQFKKKTQ